MALVFLKYIKEKNVKLKNAERILKEKKKEILEIYPDAEIYLFRSVAEGKYNILSDVDVAIVTDSKEDKRIEIQKILGFPFEVHLFSKKDWEKLKKMLKYKKV